MSRFQTFSFGILWATVAAFAVEAHAAFQLYSPPADNAIVNDGPLSNPVVIKGISSGSGGYAGMYWQAPSGFTFADLSILSSDYQMLEGTTFHGGSPRFTLFDDNFNAAYVYWGTALGGGTYSDPNGGVYGNTGNLIGSTGDRYESNGFGGITTSSPLYTTYADFASQVSGTTPITYITLDLDGSFAGDQKMLFDKFTVNTDVYDAQLAAVPETSAVITWTLMAVTIGSVAWFHRRTMPFDV